MITVVAIILVLAGLIVGISSYALKKGALSRATGELQALASACENYKTDFGNYPEDGLTTSSGPQSDTVTLCPLIDGAFALTDSSDPGGNVTCPWNELMSLRGALTLTT